MSFLKRAFQNLFVLLRSLLFFVFKVSSWNTLKTVGNAYISLFTILVPILGYLVFTSNLTLIGIERVLIFAEKWGMDIDTLGDDGLIRLKMTYVGLSIVGLSTLAFQILCPKTIKTYADAREFTLTSISVSHNDGIEHISDRLNKGVWYQFFSNENGNNSVSFKDAYEGAAPNVMARVTVDATLKRSPWLELNTDQLNKAYLILYEWENLSLVVVRSLLLVGFAVGYGIALIPSLQILKEPAIEVYNYISILLVSDP